MPLTYEPTDILARSLMGVAKLVAATEQFQLETGKNAATSLDEHCQWPHVPKGSDGQLILPAPLALVSMEADSTSAKPILMRPFNRLADGELLLQVGLVQNDELTDHRDQFAEAADRFAILMKQLLALGSSQTGNHWHVTQWDMHQAPGLNDLNEYPFKDQDGNPFRVWIFPATVTWRG